MPPSSYSSDSTEAGSCPIVAAARSRAAPSFASRTAASKSSLPTPGAAWKVRTTFVVCESCEYTAPGPAMSTSDSCSCSGRSSAGKSVQASTAAPAILFVRPSPAGRSAPSAPGKVASGSFAFTRGSTASSTWMTRTGSPGRTISTSTRASLASSKTSPEAAASRSTASTG